MVASSENVGEISPLCRVTRCGKLVARGKLRADLNVPVKDGWITDLTRLQLLCPTIRELCVNVAMPGTGQQWLWRLLRELRSHARGQM
jgi:hypothetical protein